MIKDFIEIIISLICIVFTLAIGFFVLFCVTISSGKIHLEDEKQKLKQKPLLLNVEIGNVTMPEKRWDKIKIVDGKRGVGMDSFQERIYEYIKKEERNK